MEVVRIERPIRSSGGRSLALGRLRGGGRVIVKTFGDPLRCRTEMRAVERIRDSGADRSLYPSLVAGIGRALEDREVAWAAEPPRASDHPRTILYECCGALSGPRPAAPRVMLPDGLIAGHMRDVFAVVADLHGRAGLVHGDLRPGSFARDSDGLRLVELDTCAEPGPRAAAADSWALGLILHSAAHGYPDDAAGLPRGSWANPLAPLAADLAARLMRPAPAERLRATDALRHPLFHR